MKIVEKVVKSHNGDKNQKKNCKMVQTSRKLSQFL